MTPDVSGVMQILGPKPPVDEWPNGNRRWHEIQQAAEQACYRYALAMLERLLNRKTPEAVGGWAVKERILRDEMEAVQQLIAGSA